MSPVGKPTTDIPITTRLTQLRHCCLDTKHCSDLTCALDARFIDVCFGFVSASEKTPAPTGVFHRLKPENPAQLLFSNQVEIIRVRLQLGKRHICQSNGIAVRIVDHCAIGRVRGVAQEVRHA